MIALGSKYGAKPTIVGGIRFASKAEAERYAALRILEYAGKIRDLRLQPCFQLQAAFVDNKGRRWSAIKYHADFAYFEPGNPREVIEEVKSPGTARARDFSVRLRLFLYQHPELDYRLMEA